MLICAIYAQGIYAIGIYAQGILRIATSTGTKNRDFGMPSNHECNASLERDGYDNEICLLRPVAGDVKLKTIYRPEDGGYVGEIDLHFGSAYLTLDSG